MAIIKPSLVFEGSHLGDRHNPDPGYYNAKLHSVQINAATNNSYQLEWLLTDHPSPNIRWIVRQWFPRKNPGLLSRMLWMWKRIKLEALGENEGERLESLRKLIGEEASIRYEAWDPENTNSGKVTEVWPPGSEAQSWAEAEYAMD
jgi:hypothetical protein